MIRFVGGKPGAGKTLYSVVQLVEELRTTNRMIVTNMAIELHPWVDGGGKARKGLLASLHDRYGSTFDAEDRIHLLTDDEVQLFFLVRPRRTAEGIVRERLELQEDKRFRAPVGMEGCCYFLDEAHEFWPSREWQKCGRSVLSWGSQQRRAGDDAWFLTQVIGNVEKQLRGVSQECTWLVNHRHQRLAVFRQPDMLSYRVYSSTPPPPSEAWLVMGKVKFDREWVYGIYNTAKGVGVHGTGKADIGVRAKGMHWSNVVWIFLAFSVLLYFLNRGIQFGVGKATRIVPAATAAATGLVSQVAAPLSVVATQEVKRVREDDRTERNPERERDLRPWVVASFLGRSESGQQAGALMLSDGRTLRGTNVQEVFNGWVLDGHFLSSVPTEATNVTKGEPRSVTARR